jgi:hypothetical protein
MILQQSDRDLVEQKVSQWLATNHGIAYDFLPRDFVNKVVNVGLDALIDLWNKQEADDAARRNPEPVLKQQDQQDAPLRPEYVPGGDGDEPVRRLPAQDQ